MKKEKFDITGMTCSACSTRVEQCVRKLPGVNEVSVNLLKNSMVVSYDEQALDTAGIVAAVENTGYGAIPQTAAPHSSSTAKRPETAAANTAKAAAITAIAAIDYKDTSSGFLEIGMDEAMKPYRVSEDEAKERKLLSESLYDSRSCLSLHRQGSVLLKFLMIRGAPEDFPYLLYK